MRVVWTLLLVLIHVAGFSGSGQSQSVVTLYQAQTVSCDNPGNATPAEIIEACTLALDSGRLDRAHAARAHGTLGLAYFALRQQDRALDELNEAILLGSMDVGHFMARGIIFRELRQYDSAIDDFDQATWLSRDFSEAYMQRGLAYSAVGDNARAVIDFDTAIRNNPDNPAPYEGRSRVYRALGQPALSAEDDARAKELRRGAMQSRDN